MRALLAQLSWTNHLLILRGTKTIEEKEFYIRLCIKNNDSKRELRRQIASHSPTAISTYETKWIDKKMLQKKLMEYQEAFDGKYDDIPAKPSE